VDFGELEVTPQSAPIDDKTISESINSGRFEDAKIRIAFRQMKALEALVAEAVKMGRPPFMASVEDLTDPIPKMLPGELKWVPPTATESLAKIAAGIDTLVERAEAADGR
jgi:hypothetical protein